MYSKKMKTGEYKEKNDSEDSFNFSIDKKETSPIIQMKIKPVK